MDGIGLGLSALVLALTLLAVVAWLKGYFLQQEAGLPAGDVIYTDTGTWYPQAEPLFDPHLQLVGRPDYLVEQADGGIVPVEVKSRPAPPHPYESDVLQLAAYCLLVETVYGTRPGGGIIQYKDKAFSVTFTEELEEDVLDVLSDMREDLFADDVDRLHNDWRRCSRCGHRNHCYQRLA